MSPAPDTRVVASAQSQTVSLGAATGVAPIGPANCGNGGYVLLDGGGNIWKSTDFVDWSLKKTIINPGVIGAVVYGAGMYVVVETLDSAHCRVWTSPDGETWTNTATISLSGGRIKWDGSQFIITTRNSTGGHPIATSPDAVTWTMHTFPPNIASSAATGAGVTVVTVLEGFRGTTGPLPHSIYTTTDFSSWTYRSNPFDTDPSLGAANDSEVWDIAWNGSMFVAVGQSYWNDVSGVHLSHSVATSPDGITWTACTSPFDLPLHPTVGGAAHAVNWNGTWWTVVGTGPEGFTPGNLDAGGPFIATSDDGVTWTRRRVANPTVDPAGPSWDQGYCVDGTGGTTVAGGDHRTVGDEPLASSSDGVTWDVPAVANFPDIAPTVPVIYGIAMGGGGCGCNNAGRQAASTVRDTRVVAKAS